MKSLLSFILVLTLGLSCTSPNQGNLVHYTKLEAKEFIESFNKEEKGKALLIDVRTEKEFSRGSLQGAQNINYYGDFEKEIAKLDTSKTLYVFCKAGGRSSQSIKAFQKIGFKKIFELKSGFDSVPQDLRK